MHFVKYVYFIMQFLLKMQYNLGLHDKNSEQNVEHVTASGDKSQLTSQSLLIHRHPQVKSN